MMTPERVIGIVLNSFYKILQMFDFSLHILAKKKCYHQPPNIARNAIHSHLEVANGQNIKYFAMKIFRIQSLLF